MKFLLILTFFFNLMGGQHTNASNLLSNKWPSDIKYQREAGPFRPTWMIYQEVGNNVVAIMPGDPRDPAYILAEDGHKYEPSKDIKFRPLNGPQDGKLISLVRPSYDQWNKGKEFITYPGVLVRNYEEGGWIIDPLQLSNEDLKKLGR
jgi:hypothetical protein